MSQGVVVTAIILIVLMVIHAFCNIKGIQLDAVMTGSTSAVCAMLIYHGLTKKEKNKEDQK